VLKRHLWLGFLGLAVGAAWACAQSPTFSLWDFTSTPPAASPKTEAVTPAPAQTPTAAKPANEELQPQLLGPEIWRLPAVAAAPPPMPAALTVPPAETLPAPEPSGIAPVINAPASLSGVLSGSEPIKINGPKTDDEKLWTGSFDLGLDGAEGNSDDFNVHCGFHAARKAENNALTLGVDYNERSNQNVITTNRMFFDGRFEWLFHDSLWSWFFHETVEYDEFQSFNVRDTSDAGFGYRLIKNEKTTLIGRFGAGYSHYFGGPDNGSFFPEAVFGAQLEHQISKRQKIVGVVEYAPDISDFLRYRLRTQAAWEVLLDAERNLSLRLGVLDLYNSVPNGAKPNDLDYALVLLWKF
jgi:hypothetical protein